MSVTHHRQNPLECTSTPLCILNLVFHTSFLSQFLFIRSVRWLLVTANVLSSPTLVTLMMEELSSSETSVITIRLNIPEYGIFQCQEHLPQTVPITLLNAIV
jgi:hypothetical protein